MAKKKTVKKKDATQDEVSFETSLAELEQIVATLEGGELGLDASLKQYESGIRHLRRCQSELDRAERQIELLSGVDAEGNPITEPFDAEATESLVEKGESRSRKRSAKRPSGGVDDSPGLF